MRLTAFPSPSTAVEVDRPAAPRNEGLGRGRGASLVDAGRQRPEVLVGEQPCGRVLGVRRVGQERVPIGHRELGGLDADVDPPASSTPAGPKAPAGGGSKAREQPDDLEGDDARAVRRMARRPDAAIVDADRLLPGRALGARSAALIGEPAAARPGTWRAASSPSYRSSKPAVARCSNDRAERRQADELARVPAPGVRPVDRGPSPRRGRAGRPRRKRPRSPRPRRCSHPRPGSRPPPARSPGPGPRRATAGRGRAWAAPQGTNRPGRGDRAAAREAGRVAIPARREWRRVHRRRSPARPVECRLAAGRRIPDEPERVAADPAALGHLPPRARRSWRSPRPPPNPPARSTPSPAAVARWWGATTAPWRPRARGAGTSGLSRATRSPSARVYVGVGPRWARDARPNVTPVAGIRPVRLGGHEAIAVGRHPRHLHAPVQHGAHRCAPQLLPGQASPARRGGSQPDRHGILLALFFAAELVLRHRSACSRIAWGITGSCSSGRSSAASPSSSPARPRTCSSDRRHASAGGRLDGGQRAVDPGLHRDRDAPVTSCSAAGPSPASRRATLAGIGVGLVAAGPLYQVFGRERVPAQLRRSTRSRSASTASA